MLLAACDTGSPPPAGEAEADGPPPAVASRTPAVPTPEPPLARRDLLAGAARAASLYAEGQPGPIEDPLVGREFSVRIAFGCNGPVLPGGEVPGVGHWSWGDDGATIRLGMRPADWQESAILAQAGAGETWEAIEGFWLPRPWQVADGCPVARGDPLQTVAAVSPQTLGLAAVFEAGGSRVGRREGRAYQFTVRAEGEEKLAPPEDGFRLLLEGRVAAFPSGRGVECRASGPEERPVCIVATRLDRVAFEQPDGTVQAEWRTD